MGASRGRTFSAVLVLAAAAIASTGLSVVWVGVVRDILHWDCEYLTDGEYSDWVCADGISYITPTIAIVLMQAAVLIAAAALVVLQRRRPGLWRGLPAALLGPCLILLAVVGLAHGSLADLHPLQLSAAGCLALAAVVGVAAASIGSGRAALPLLGLAVIAALAAAVIAPILLPLSIVDMGIGIAAWLVLPSEQPL
jgi:hypothetical protein